MNTFAPAQSFNSDRFNPFKRKRIENTTSVYSPQPIQSLKTGGIKYDNGTVVPSFPVSKPVTTAPKKKPTLPSSTTQSSADTNFLSDIDRIAAEQQEFLENRARSEQDMANQTYNRKIKVAQDQAPLAQQAYDQFRTDTTAQAATAKGNAEDQWGNDQRALAQTRRESEGRNRNRYAALNTADSFGAGSYQGAQENVESNFNRDTAQGLRNKSSSLTQIDQQANSLIAQEGIKLKQTLLSIQNTIFDSEEQKAAAIKKAYDEMKAGVLGIKQYVSELKYNKALSDEQTANAIKLKQADEVNLSDQFIKTGVPQTAADFVFRMKNPAGFKEYGTSAGQSEETSSIVSLIDKIANGDVKAITGLVKSSWIPGTSGALTKNYYDQLKGMLSLENRQKLKGSGAISDFESRVLEKAASALGQNLSETQFRQVLDDMRNELMSGSAPSNTGNQMIRVRERSSGQTGQIPANEFNPALYDQLQ